MAKPATTTAETPQRTRRTEKAAVDAPAVTETAVAAVEDSEPTKRRRRAMSNEHKGALAAGRAEGRTVRLYLEALEKTRPKRGRKRTAESVQRELEQVDSELETAAAVQRLMLLQRRIDLQHELEQFHSPAADLADLQAEFVQVARTFGARKGIGYSTWREAGVPTSVLKEAGVARSS